MKSVLVTGCNRGIGAEFVRQFAADEWRVFATCRNPVEAGDLTESGRNVSLHKLDVTDPRQIQEVSKELENTPIDVLLLNAGFVMASIGGHNPKVGQLDYDIWRKAIEVNTFGPMRVVEALLDNVVQSEEKLIILISSRMGSISFNQTGGSYAYRSSKAALNMVAKNLAVDLRPLGVGVVVIHPGNVKSYSTPRCKVEVSESVSSMMKLIGRCTLEDTGVFYKYDGTMLPW